MQTLVNMIQIGQWYRKHQNKDYGPSKYCLVVKFWNIEDSVLHAIQTGSADDKLLPDVDGLADLDNKDEANDKPLELEIDACQPAQNVAFKIHPDIDINSKALRDMVSTDSVSTDSIDLSLDLVLSLQAAIMIDNRDADWNDQTRRWQF